MVRAQQRMRLRFAEPDAVEQAAEASGLSRRTYQRRFREATGMTPTQHLQLLRIEKAKLIDRRRDGRLHLIRARATGLAEAQSWINQCAAAWEYSFDRLDQLLKNQPRKEKAP